MFALRVMGRDVVMAVMLLVALKVVVVVVVVWGTFVMYTSEVFFPVVCWLTGVVVDVVEKEDRESEEIMVAREASECQSMVADGKKPLEREGCGMGGAISSSFGERVYDGFFGEEVWGPELEAEGRPGSLFSSEGDRVMSLPRSVLTLAPAVVREPGRFDGTESNTFVCFPRLPPFVGELPCLPRCVWGEEDDEITS